MMKAIECRQSVGLTRQPVAKIKLSPRWKPRLQILQRRRYAERQYFPYHGHHARFQYSAVAACHAPHRYRLICRIHSRAMTRIAFRLGIVFLRRHSIISFASKHIGLATMSLIIRRMHHRSPCPMPVS